MFKFIKKGVHSSSAYGTVITRKFQSSKQFTKCFKYLKRVNNKENNICTSSVCFVLDVSFKITELSTVNFSTSHHQQHASSKSEVMISPYERGVYFKRYVTIYSAVQFLIQSIILK